MSLLFKKLVVLKSFSLLSFYFFFTCFISAIEYLWLYLHYIMVKVIMHFRVNFWFVLMWASFVAQIEVNHDNFLFQSLSKPTFISHSSISKTVRYHNMCNYCSHISMSLLQEFRETNVCFERCLCKKTCNICHPWTGTYIYMY